MDIRNGERTMRTVMSGSAVRPSHEIDRLEKLSRDGGKLTGRQCALLWEWVACVEDELLMARSRIAALTGQPQPAMHADLALLDALYQTE